MEDAADAKPPKSLRPRKPESEHRVSEDLVEMVPPKIVLRLGDDRVDWLVVVLSMPTGIHPKDLRPSKLPHLAQELDHLAGRVPVGTKRPALVAVLVHVAETEHRVLIVRRLRFRRLRDRATTVEGSRLWRLSRSCHGADSS